MKAAMTKSKPLWKCRQPTLQPGWLQIATNGCAVASFLFFSPPDLQFLEGEIACRRLRRFCWFKQRQKHRELFSRFDRMFLIGRHIEQVTSVQYFPLTIERKVAWCRRVQEHPADDSLRGKPSLLWHPDDFRLRDIN